MSLFNLRFNSIKNKNKYKNKELSPEDVFYDSLNLSSLNSDKMEGNFEKIINKNIYIILGIIFIIIICIFVYRSFIMQISDYDIWQKRSLENFKKEYPIFPNRGIIRDRNGILLAWNGRNSTDMLNTNSITNIQNSQTLSKVKDYDKYFNNLTQIVKREYIQDSGFSNILGYYSYPQKDNKGVFWKENGHGVSGLESYYNNILSGTNGNITLSHDAHDNILDKNIYEKKGEDGIDITLTLDYRLQKVLFDNLKSNMDSLNFDGGSAIVTNMNTGEILAMATYPEYNNNLWTNRDSDGKANLIINQNLEDKRMPLMERNTQLTFVPGSIVKPFIGYAVLNENIIDRWTNIFSSGKIVVKNIYGNQDSVFRDWKLGGHGYVDIVKALAVSSDEYFYQTVGGYKEQKGLGINKLSEYMNIFYLNKSTNIDFPEESLSQIPSIDLKKELTGEDWLLGNTYHAAIGQDDWRLSPISVARSLSFIARDGISEQLHVVKDFQSDQKDIIVQNIINQKTNEYQNFIKNGEVKINLNQENLNYIKDGMLAVTKSDGTGHWLGNLPFEIHAKTGTAQLGSQNQYHNSWAIGFWESKTGVYYGFVYFMDKGPSNNTVGASKLMREVFDRAILENIIDEDGDIK